MHEISTWTSSACKIFILKCSFAISVVAVFTGCTATAVNSKITALLHANVSSTEKPIVAIQPQIVSNDEDPGGTPLEVFERAKLKMKLEEHKKARLLFDRVVEATLIDATKDSMYSPLARAAAYNAALCSEQLDEALDARNRFRQLASKARDTSDALDAQFRRARLDVEIEDFDDLPIAVADLLVRTDLNDGDRGEVYALQAMGLVHKGELDEAEKALSTAQRYVHSLDEAKVSPPHNVAVVAFARGELLRARSLSIKLTPVRFDFSEKLEARCQKLLEAENAYVESIRTKQLRWAVRAGVRVASLYRALHDELLSVSTPVAANTPARQALFRGAMRLRYRIILEKSIRTLDRTLNLESQKMQNHQRWFELARSAKQEMQQQLIEEKTEFAKLPYTEAQLQKAFDDLKDLKEEQ